MLLLTVDGFEQHDDGDDDDDDDMKIRGSGNLW